jgi:hypothetical protein
MRWFQRKTQKQPTKNEPDVKTPISEGESPHVEKAEPQELLLLLLRPSISKIFESPTDNSLIDAAAIMTSFGMHGVEGINKHQIERLPMLFVSESGRVGYTVPMRLDLQVLLHQLATRADPPIDYPFGLFTNCDVIMVVDGFYTVRLFHSDADVALTTWKKGNEEFVAPHIAYMGTTTDEETLTSLRRLETTAKQLLSSTASHSGTLSKLPQLPPEIHDFLKPIFKRAEEVIRKA